MRGQIAQEIQMPSSLHGSSKKHSNSMKLTTYTEMVFSPICRNKLNSFYIIQVVTKRNRLKLLPNQLCHEAGLADKLKRFSTLLLKQLQPQVGTVMHSEVQSGYNLTQIPTPASKLKKHTSKPPSKHLTPILECIFDIPSRNIVDLTTEQLSSSIYSLARNKLFFQLNMLPKDKEQRATTVLPNIGVVFKGP